MIDEALLASIRARLTQVLGEPRSHCIALHVQGHAVGYLDEARAARLLQFDGVFARDGERLAFAPALVDEPSRTRALAEVARVLSMEGALTAWRDETYNVAASFTDAPLFRLERSAARYFGIVTYAAHVNGIVLSEDELCMWLARRSLTKPIDPGQLDNLVGGGVRAETTVRDTVLREAWEEAGIPRAIADQARAVNVTRICRAQADGLQREVVIVHDLLLPADFTPVAIDGEVMEHRLVPLPEAAHLIGHDRGGDTVTAEASVVVLDYLLRHGLVSPDSAQYLALAALRWPRLAPLSPTARAPSSSS